MALTALAINCTLKVSPQESSCSLLLNQAQRELEKLGVSCEQVRAVDFNIKPGVTSDEGEGDDWPMIREKLLAADILILGTPIWLGHPSSVCQRVLERLDAFIGESGWSRTGGLLASLWWVTRMAPIMWLPVSIRD
ncbi:flavodoxin family protein [Pseudomonas sp. NPDC047961]